MGDLDMIRELCGIVQLQSRIIKAQAEALAQLDAEVAADEIAQARELKNRLGLDEG